MMCICCVAHIVSHNTLDTLCRPLLSAATSPDVLHTSELSPPFTILVFSDHSSSSKGGQSVRHECAHAGSGFFDGHDNRYVRRLLAVHRQAKHLLCSCLITDNCI